MEGNHMGSQTHSQKLPWIPGKIDLSSWLMTNVDHCKNSYIWLSWWQKLKAWPQWANDKTFEKLCLPGYSNNEIEYSWEKIKDFTDKLHSTVFFRSMLLLSLAMESAFLSLLLFSGKMTTWPYSIHHIGVILQEKHDFQWCTCILVRSKQSGGSAMLRKYVIFLSSQAYSVIYFNYQHDIAEPVQPCFNWGQMLLFPKLGPHNKQHSNLSSDLHAIWNPGMKPSAVVSKHKAACFKAATLKPCCV